MLNNLFGLRRAQLSPMLTPVPGVGRIRNIHTCMHVNVCVSVCVNKQISEVCFWLLSVAVAALRLPTYMNISIDMCWVEGGEGGRRSVYM